MLLRLASFRLFFVSYLLGRTTHVLSFAPSGSNRNRKRCWSLLKADPASPTTTRQQESKLPRTTTTSISPNLLAVFQEFSSLVKESIEKNEFVCLALHGSSIKSKRQSSNPADECRGAIRQVNGRLIQLHGFKHLQLTFKYHGATDIVKNVEISHKDNALLGVDSVLHDVLLGRVATIGAASEWGDLAATSSSAAIKRGKLLLQSGLQYDFTSKSKRIQKRWVQQKERVAGAGTLQQGNLLQQHDRTKQAIPLSPAFVKKIGLDKQKMKRKLRQCQKFIEIVEGLIDQVVPTAADSNLEIVDMGCGKGYLTFSLHDYLVGQSSTTANVSTLGIDVRPKLIQEMHQLSKELGYAPSLHFQQGTIQDACMPSVEGKALVSEHLSAASDKDQDGAPDQKQTTKVLIALHACDTATDDALWFGMNTMDADILVVAPCCHKELRSQLKGDKLLYRHGIYRERMNEMITDAFRALLLEYAGYSNVKVFEFIGGEHTSKNVMITAIRSSSRKKDEEKKRRRVVLHQIQEFCVSHGIRKQRLADRMKLKLTTITDEHRPPGNATKKVEDGEEQITRGSSFANSMSQDKQRRLRQAKGTMPPLLGP